jgi:hypothetical protein
LQVLSPSRATQSQGLFCISRKGKFFCILCIGYLERILFPSLISLPLLTRAASSNSSLLFLSFFIYIQVFLCPCGSACSRASSLPLQERWVSFF